MGFIFDALQKAGDEPGDDPKRQPENQPQPASTEAEVNSDAAPLTPSEATTPIEATPPVEEPSLKFNIEPTAETEPEVITPEPSIDLGFNTSDNGLSNSAASVVNDQLRNDDRIDAEVEPDPQPSSTLQPPPKLIRERQAKSDHIDPTSYVLSQTEETASKTNEENPEVSTSDEDLRGPINFQEAVNTLPPPELIAKNAQCKPLWFSPRPLDIGENKLDDRLVGITEPMSVMCEEYRSIRTSLLAKWSQSRSLVHTITSATPQEGKTITSLNLGMSFAELHSRRTIVIECDLRLPTFGKLFGTNVDNGLVGYLRGESKLEDCIRLVGDTNLCLLPAGGRASNDAVQMLSGQRMVSLLTKLRGYFDHIIIDTPPVIELADAGILGALSDDVLLIARMSRTPVPLIEQATRILRSYNAPVAGTIATDQTRRGKKYYYYRYGYRYRETYHRKAA